MPTELETLTGMLRARPFDLTAPPEKLRRQADRMATLFPPPKGVAIAPDTLGGVPAERLNAGDGPILLYLHGGGFVMGSPASHRHLTALLARDIGGTVYALDYRLAPEAPFPAASDDVLAAYGALVARHPGAQIAIAGDSAGGGLTFLAAIRAREAGLPKPAALVGISPWVNLGTEHEAYDLLAAGDLMLSRDICGYFAGKYLGGAAAHDPDVSPLFADLRDLPPSLIQIGDRECFYGDAVRMQMALIAAGADAELFVGTGMFHVWHLYWPMLAAGRAAVDRAAAFIRTHCTR